MRPLKGWNETEPVFVKRTDKTVGVISIKSLGLKINNENIHRLELFLKVSGAEKDENVTKQQYKCRECNISKTNYKIRSNCKI